MPLARPSRTPRRTSRPSGSSRKPGSAPARSPAPPRYRPAPSRPAPSRSPAPPRYRPAPSRPARPQRVGGSHPVGGPSRQPQGRPSRPATNWDYTVVQSYLPPSIAEQHPIRAPGPQRPPQGFQGPPQPFVPADRRDELQRRPPTPLGPAFPTAGRPIIKGQDTPVQPPPPGAAQATPSQPPPYPQVPQQATPTATGYDAFFEGLGRHIEQRWKPAQEAVNKSGRGNYVPLWPEKTTDEQPWGLAGLQHNLLQVPVTGKLSTAVWESFKFTGQIGAELIEKTIGDQYYRNTGDPTRKRLGIDGDPVKEQAWQAALGVTYSGPKAIEAAYKDALKLAQQGQLSPENMDLVQARHGSWWREALGQMIDPLSLLGAGTKVVKMAKWTAGSRKMFTAAWKIGSRLADTAEVTAKFSKIAQRSGQLASAEGLLDEALAFINPRDTATVIHRTAERMSQMVNMAAGVSNKLAKVNGRLPAEAFQEVATQWAKMASDDLNEVEKAAEALGKMGFESGPQSEMGRYTGVILDRIMKKPNGEVGDLMDTLKVAREESIPAEDVAYKFYNKAMKVMEEIVQPQKWEKGMVHKTAQAILTNKVRRASDSTFANMFMGANPGYAANNFFDNNSRIMVNGYSPFKPLQRIAEKAGFKVQTFRSIIGQAEGSTKWPAARAAEYIEKFGRGRVEDQAYGDAINRIVPKALEQIPDLPKNLRGVVRDLFKQPIDAIDKLVGKTVETWRVIDDESVKALNQTDPPLYDHLVDLLNKAKTPEEALAGIRTMQGQYVKHIDQATKTAKNIGQVNGTLAGQAAEMLQGSGKMKPKEIDTLADQLSGLEHNIRLSRNKAVSSLYKSVAPEQWQATLQKAEDVFQRAVWEIQDRQLKGWVRVLNGEITPKKYADHLMSLYAEAHRNLDGVFTTIIKSTGGPSFTGKTPTPLLRWVLEREGVANKAASATEQGVPNPHLINKVKEFLSPDRAKVVKSLDDLTDDELVASINSLRMARDSSFAPMHLEDIVNQYANRVPEITLRDFPKMTAIPEMAERSPELAKLHLERNEIFEAIEETEKMIATKGENVVRGEVSLLQARADELDNLIDDMSTALDAQDMERLAQKAKDPAAQAALIAAQAAGEVGPSPSVLDSVYQTAKEGTALLDNIADDIMQRSLNPVREGAVITEEIALKLKQLYTETHTIAAETARRAGDNTLLDYADRRYLDPLMKVIYPWHYWWSRSVPNWAASLSTNPAMTAGYMKLKKELREYNNNDPSVPEWAKDNIVLQPPGYPGKMFWDFDNAFNAVGNIMDTFDDPARHHDAFGDIISKLGTVGPATHPLLMMAYAAERGLLHGDEEGARSLGYLAPATKAFASITGKTLEPWLWLKDPGTGERQPFTGGTQWDIEKARRKLAYEQGTGRFGAEEAVLGAATGAGPAFTEVLTEDIADYRRLPTLLSFALGIRGVTPRQDWEVEMQDLNSQYSGFMAAGETDKAQDLLMSRPELSTMWFSWDNEAARMRMLANNVFARIPPMPGDKRGELLQRAGLNEFLMDQFYETTKGNKQGLTDWDRRDYDQLVDGVIDLAEMFKIPDKSTAKEWREARTKRQQMEEALSEKFPNGTQQNEVYWGLIQAGQEEEAREYFGITPELGEYWMAKNKYLAANPIMVKYYQQPEKVDQMAESFAREAMVKNHPDYWEKRNEFFDIPEDDWKARREFKRQYPYAVDDTEYKELVKQYREQFSDLREYSQSELGAPETVDYIIEGKPNATQRAVLQTIAALERDVAAEVPLPKEKPETITPEQKALYQARDDVYAKLVENFPEYPSLDREYDQIKYIYGAEAAKIFGQQSGYFDMRDQERLLSLSHPEIIKDMSDDDLEYTAKAVMRSEANKIWPGLDNTLDTYYGMGKKERRAFAGDNPQVYAYFDWKGPAEAHYKQMLYQRRVAARKQEVAKQSTPQAPEDTATGGELVATDLAEAFAQAESGGKYKARNPNSSASGAYQYIDSTWNNYGGYAHASEAPPEVQDKRMVEDIKARAAQYGNDIEKVIAAHYYPAWANNPENWDKSPAPGQPTVRAYVDSVLRRLRK